MLPQRYEKKKNQYSFDSFLFSKMGGAYSSAVAELCHSGNSSGMFWMIFTRSKRAPCSSAKASGAGGTSAKASGAGGAKCIHAVGSVLFKQRISTA